MKNIILLLLLSPLFFSCSDDAVEAETGVEDISVVLSVSSEHGTPTTTSGWPVSIDATAWSEQGDKYPPNGNDYYLHIFHQEVGSTDNSEYYYDDSKPLSYNTELSFEVKTGDITDIQKSYNVYAIINSTPKYTKVNDVYTSSALPDYLKCTLEIYRIN